MEIGTQIKQLRTQRGITQEALAEQLSVSPQAVSKWERGAATPDIQLLPAISAFFGVSIDELFALSDETRMERIQNMLWDERVLNPDTVARERAFLLEKGRREPENSEVYRLLADMENKLSDEYARKAADFALESIRRQPGNDGAHAAYVAARKGDRGPWYYANHHELIDFYKDFVEKYPHLLNGYLWLLDHLIDDHRLDEAEEYCDRLEKLPEAGYRPANFRGEIAWAAGEHKQAIDIWKEMCHRFSDNLNVWVRMGDHMARAGCWEEAKACYRKFTDVQTQRPRYLDGVMSIASICEIQGDLDGAIAAQSEVVEMTVNEWNTPSGEEVDYHRREIARLQEKKQRA